MIVETIFSTVDESGNPNFAPMGLVWGAESVTVRPFHSSQTFRNMHATGQGIANLTDDVLAFVQCGLLNERLPSFPAIRVKGAVFKQTCSWLELTVLSRVNHGDRSDFQCQILHKGNQREFVGFCRAANAVIEAAILATRLTIHGCDEVRKKLNGYLEIVEKTGGEREMHAFQMILNYVREWEA